MAEYITNKDMDILWSRVEDGMANAQNWYTPSFIGFLDTAQMSTIGERIAKKGCFYRFFGGYDDSDRCFLGIFPDDQIDKRLFPIKCIKLTWRDKDKLSHRDFLGSLMALRIKRESVGDICVINNEAYIFLTTHAGDVVVNEINQIGRIGVSVTEIQLDHFVFTPNFLEIIGSVASLRLDCVVAFLGNQSRSHATSAISGNLVAINGIYITRCDKTIKEGDKISIRGVGKFIYDEELGVSKKNKLRLKFRKYQ